MRTQGIVDAGGASSQRGGCGQVDQAQGADDDGGPGGHRHGGEARRARPAKAALRAVMETSTAWRALPGNAAKVLAVMWDLGFVREDQDAHMVAAYAKTVAIAERSGLGLRATSRWISYLRKRGWISTTARRIGMTVVGLNFVVFTSPAGSIEPQNRVFGGATPERTFVRSGERTSVRSGERTFVRSRTPSRAPSTTTTTGPQAADVVVRGGGGDVLVLPDAPDGPPAGPQGPASGLETDGPDRAATVNAMISAGIQRPEAERLADVPAVAAAGAAGIERTAKAISREPGIKRPDAVLVHRLRAGAIEPAPKSRPASAVITFDYGIDRIDPADVAPPDEARSALASIRAMLRTGKGPEIENT
jgi:hypothetical protein